MSLVFIENVSSVRVLGSVPSLGKLDPSLGDMSLRRN